jgi:hypothetical protein
MAKFLRKRADEPVVVPARSTRREARQSPPNAIVAAATRLVRPIRGANGGYGGAPLKVPTREWQIEAWRQYDLESELHFATNWLANSLGRCRLTVCPVDESGVIGPPTDDKEVLGLVSGLLDDPACQHEMIAAITRNLTIAGDGYIIGTPGVDSESFDDWIALSAKEVQIGLDGSVTVNRGDSEPYQVDTGQSLVIRVHRPHPRLWYEADSPTRAALPILRELEELSKYLFATINSRLAGAGILALPSEMSFPSPVSEIQPGETPFMSTLSEAMLAPIEDMSNPAALVPVVIEAPKDALGGIQWLTSPNSGLPAQIESLRERAIARLAVVLDLNATMLTGAGLTSHWGEWAIEEQSIKFHVEPVMILICNAITTGFLQPSLKAAGLDVKRWVIWYDPADLINRPAKGTDAKDLYDRGELSGAALRRETGFSEFEAPSETEKMVMTAFKIIAAAPAYAETLIPHLIDLLGLGSVVKAEDLIPQPSPVGTPAQDPPPDPNKDPKAIPVQKPKPAVSPRKDSKTPEPTQPTK